MEVIQSNFYDYNGIKLEINNRRVFRRPSNTQKPYCTLINNPAVKKEIKQKLLNALNGMKIENQRIKTSGSQPAAKTWFRDNFMALNACVRKEERS